MSEKNEKFKEFLGKLSKEELDLMNRKEFEQAEKDFKYFKECVQGDVCPLCNNSFSYFKEDAPCIHWLLGSYGPNDFKKKKHFPLVYEKYSYHEISDYFKWMANVELTFFNINNLKEEKSSSKIIEYTIKYKNIEWSFSCGEGDMNGHDKFKGANPHYHFQMKDEKGIVIKFNDFHVPFHEYDLFVFSIKNGDFGGKIEYRDVFGAGSQEFFDSVKPSEIIKYMKKSEEESASIESFTVFSAEDGCNIKSEDIMRLIEKSKKTGKPIAVFAEDIKNVNIAKMITPGPAIPEIKKRSPKKHA